MSLMWRRLISDGPNSYHVMQKVEYLVPKGGICPCNDQWYIVSVCPCPDCQKHKKYFLGAPVMDGVDPVTIEYEGDPTTLYALGMSWHAPTDSATADLPGKVSQWEAQNAPLGAILLAVKHTTNETPYSNCSVHAELFIDGTSKAEWSGGGYGSGVQVEIGYGIEGQTEEKVLEVDYAFESAGCHNVDLRVTFSAIGHENVVYTCRQTYRIVDGGNEFYLPWIGAIAVIPYSPGMFDFACIIEGMHPDTGFHMAMYLNPLKGPFDSQADAAAALSYFAAFIHAYAATCTCDTDCGNTALAADSLDNYGGSWWLGMSAAGTNAGAYCDVGWIRYEYGIVGNELPEGTSVEGTLIDPWGAETDAPESGLLPPCWYLRFKAHGFQGNEEFEISPINGWASGRFSVNCVTEDEESEFYGLEWDYIPWDENNPLVPPEGVPSSSADLRNYEAYLNYQE